MRNKIIGFCNQDSNIVIDKEFSVPGNNPQDYLDGIFGLSLSCYSRQIRDLIIEKLGRNPTHNQMRYMLHYLANPLDFGYIDEIHYYSTLMIDQNYLGELPENLQNRLKDVLIEVLSYTSGKIE